MLFFLFLDMLLFLCFSSFSFLIFVRQWAQLNPDLVFAVSSSLSYHLLNNKLWTEEGELHAAEGRNVVKVPECCDQREPESDVHAADHQVIQKLEGADGGRSQRGEAAVTRQDSDPTPVFDCTRMEADWGASDLTALPGTATVRSCGGTERPWALETVEPMRDLRRSRGRGRGRCGRSSGDQDQRSYDICRFCGKFGHWSRDCSKRRQDNGLN